MNRKKKLNFNDEENAEKKTLDFNFLNNAKNNYNRFIYETYLYKYV